MLISIIGAVEKDYKPVKDDSGEWLFLRGGIYLAAPVTESPKFVEGFLGVFSGIVVGLSGLWMTLFYSRHEDASDLLYVLRLVFGSGRVLSIILGHRAWMVRASAIGLGAGTQVLIGMVGELAFGPPNELENALLMGTAWVLNLAVAEWSIRRSRTRQPRAA